MLNIFKSSELQSVVVRDINTYGSIVLFNQRLSQEFVRKGLANCFVRVKKHSRSEYIDKWSFDEDDISYWLGYLLHRDNDLPAIVCTDNSQHWVQYHKYYRDNDLPAIITSEGDQHWRQCNECDKLHRDNDLPAVIYGDGAQEWYRHGNLHRDNDLPAIIMADGGRHWLQHDKRHRDNDQPAVIHGNGAKEFWKNGKQYFPEN